MIRRAGTSSLHDHASAFSDEPLFFEGPDERVDLGRDRLGRDVVLSEELRLDLRPALPVGEELPEASTRWAERKDAVRLQVDKYDLVA